MTFCTYFIELKVHVGGDAPVVQTMGCRYRHASLLQGAVIGAVDGLAALPTAVRKWRGDRQACHSMEASAPMRAMVLGLCFVIVGEVAACGMERKTGLMQAGRMWHRRNR